MTRQEDAAESFWRFSLLVYARPGIAEALIGLQDKGGHNVNLILFGLWLGLCEATRLDTAALDRAKTAIESIDRDIVGPLRRLRRALKDQVESDLRDFRRRVLTLEIAAERRAQARLAATIAVKAETGNRAAIAEANLQLILGADFISEAAVFLRRAIIPSL